MTTYTITIKTYTIITTIYFTNINITATTTTTRTST